jgi:RNA polymerase sigma-70 factor (ECF subfamily)
MGTPGRKPERMSSVSAGTGHDDVDRQDFQVFYQEHFALIYRYVYSKVGNREEAEDLVSQIFLKAVRSIDKERSWQSMQQWLFQVARTTIADYWRVHYRLTVSSLDELLEAGWQGPADEETAVMNSRPEELVERILQLLPEQYREVLTYRFLLNLSIRDTAQRMGLTETHVKVLQFRALKRAAALEAIASGERGERHHAR